MPPLSACRRYKNSSWLRMVHGGWRLFSYLIFLEYAANTWHVLIHGCTKVYFLLIFALCLNHHLHPTCCQPLPPGHYAASVTTCRLPGSAGVSP